MIGDHDVYIFSLKKTSETVLTFMRTHKVPWYITGLPNGIMEKPKGTFCNVPVVETEGCTIGQTGTRQKVNGI
jgi:hypothetical protein